MDNFQTRVSITSSAAAQSSLPRVTAFSIKQCSTELRKQALERLLSAVYQREVSLALLLVEGGVSHSVLENLRFRGLGPIAEMIIDEIQRMICAAEGGQRRFQIIERYYGLDGNLPARLSAMSAKHNVSRERVRQIKERALISLRYKKSVIENILMTLSMRLMTRPLYEQAPPPNLFVQEAEGAKLLTHRQLLLMSDSSIHSPPEQEQAYSVLRSCMRGRVNGCTGSGKTWLAIRLARELAMTGHNTLLTCFNRALADYLEGVFKGQSNIVVVSFHALCLRLGKQAGITIPGGWNNRSWLERFPDVLKKAMLADPALRFDAIVVDDAHDFRDNWWQALEESFVNREQGKLYYFYDDRFLGGLPHCPMPSVEKQATLTTNLRSPASVSTMLAGSNRDSTQIRFRRKASAPVDFYQCETDEEVHKTLSHVMEELIERGSYIGSDVALITPRLARFSTVLKARLKGSSRIVRRPSDVANHAVLTRAHMFQGLERKVVIIVDLDDKFADFSDDEIKIFVYSTFSRYLDKLILLGNARSCHALQAIATATTGTTTIHSKSVQNQP
ncbi:MAG: hypothetical protein K2X93_02275 [Candidatus Obscuribacterales bacterium]|nr:hypothetical protein [Candidatus Obscuribacterales bacterium]